MCATPEAMAACKSAAFDTGLHAAADPYTTIVDPYVLDSTLSCAVEAGSKSINSLGTISSAEALSCFTRGAMWNSSLIPL